MIVGVWSFDGRLVTWLLDTRKTARVQTTKQLTPFLLFPVRNLTSSMEIRTMPSK